jgi:hypothetical protein
MAISLVNTVRATTSGSSTTVGPIALPSGLADGDVLILAVHRTHDYALSSSTPAGYTHLRNILDVATTPNAAHTDFYWRACDGSEGATGPTFTTPSTTRWVIHAAAYRGVDTADPFIAENGTVTGGTTVNQEAPQVSNTDAAAWGLYAGGARLTSPNSWTPPTGLTERADTDGGVVSSVNMISEWADSAGPIAVGDHSYTGVTSTAVASGTSWAAILRPVSLGGPPELLPPTGVNATPVSESQINVSWDPAPSATGGYDVQRDGVVIAQGHGSTSYSDTGLEQNSLHTYVIYSVGG